MPPKKKTSNPRTRNPAGSATSTAPVQQPSATQNPTQRNRKVVSVPPLNTRSSVRKQLGEQAHAPTDNDTNSALEPAENTTGDGAGNAGTSRTSRRPRPAKTTGKTSGLSGEYDPVSPTRQQEIFRAGFASQAQEPPGSSGQPKTVGGDAAATIESTATPVPPQDPSSSTPASSEATTMELTAPNAVQNSAASATHANVSGDSPPALVHSVPSAPPIRPTVPTPELPDPRNGLAAPTGGPPTVVPPVPVTTRTLNCGDNEAPPPLEVASNTQPEVGVVPETRDKGKGRATDDDVANGDGTGGGGNSRVSRDRDEVDDGENENDAILNFLLGDAFEAEGGAVNADNGNKEGESQPLKRGRLSNAAIKDIQSFGDKIRLAALKIAQKHSKDPSLVLRVAGMGIRALRARNPYNDYHSWWSAKYHERNAGIPLQEQNRMMTEDWEEFMDGVEEGDKEEVKRRMEPIYNEVDIWRKDPTQSIPYTSSRVKAAIKQFTELAQAYSAAEGLEVGGVVAYIGPDVRSKVLSSFWGGSDLIQQAISKYEINLNELMNVIVTILNALKYTNQGLDIQPPPIGIETPSSDDETDSSDIEPVPGPNGDDKRDNVRQKLGYLFVAKLKKTAKKVGWRKPPSAFPWAHFLNHGYQRKICCTGWPVWETTLGDPRGRNAFSREELDEIKDAAPHIKFVPWDPKYTKLTDAEAGDVPLLIDPSGKTIKTVRDSEQWVKDMKTLAQQKLKKSEKRAAAALKKVARQGASKGKRKSRNDDTYDVDAESGESGKEPPAKRPHASHSHDATHNCNPGPSVIDVDSHDEEESQQDPKTTDSVLADPLVTALAKMLGALPRESLQSMIGDVLNQPVAGPSRLPASGSSKKGSKHGRGSHTDT